MGKMRLDKFLADMGAGTRSQVKEKIRKGQVTVNGTCVKSADCKVDTELDVVEADGRRIGYVQLEYYMLNKPAGVVSAATDAHYRTVVELIEERSRKDLYPVGRLDIDTEGLLLITNDGDLTHRLLSPKKHVDKTYYVETDLAIPAEAVAHFAEGVVLEDGTLTMPARLEILTECSGKLTIQEGKFHQVKRMFAAEGVTVTYLKRLTMGSLCLDETLEPGEYRPLTEDELQALRVATGQ